DVFFFSTMGLILREFYSPVNPGQFSFRNRTFHSPPKLPVCSVMPEQTGGNRLMSVIRAVERVSRKLTSIIQRSTGKDEWWTCVRILSSRGSNLGGRAMPDSDENYTHPK
ncbi:hypothetical protein, partial [Acetobacter indonesiensis]|uniref:hypothetical protein n=1 Tax=Acetobacter indonesiensis TaxID=104101 RepID=UPI0039BFB4CB